MAPAVVGKLAHQARSFITERVPSGVMKAELATGAVNSLTNLAARVVLKKRDDDDDNDDDDKDNGGQEKTDPHSGVIDPHDINSTVVFVIFGLIGAAFVCAGIWFFFWAKNGGFYFKENDWDEYKSTVLRRKGPNGTLLSGATPSTDLGGGSVYKDIDDATTTITESTGLSGITAGASDIAAREKREHKRKKREREREARRAEKKNGSSRRHVDESGQLIDEDAEREAKQHLRNYRHEKPARVGGLNKESEASDWDASTNPGDSTVSSNLLSNRERTPTSTPTKSGGGIRKVYSTADRTADRERERIRTEARRLQDRGRAAGGVSTRDFSFQRAYSNVPDGSDIGSPGHEGTVPGSWAESDVGTSELGTKSYQDARYIPGSNSSGVGSDYAEEKRKNRRAAGYRRNRD